MYPHQTGIDHVRDIHEVLGRAHRGGPGERECGRGLDLTRAGQSAAAVRVAVIAENGNVVARVVRDVDLAGHPVGHVDAAVGVHVEIAVPAGACHVAQLVPTP